ncbi:DUF3140 domain-containing protein [Christiangramia echinicola]|uniref:DNA-binding protein n=1 Tax=Christiangramia echinicola TaxID=279359 RepID=A0A1H1RG62_9FLAO|nr:DUF3140 domain-containing protein [Christiangramia echinicola]SDS34744.1 Protein of unknown function [Christiangramia echinicola]
MENIEKEEIYDEFYNKVNMTPSEIERWLDTDKAKSVGKNSGDGESIGYKSGNKIITIKRKNKSELNNSDYEHMKKVNSYIARHSAQKPEDGIKESDWRYSLKNWGHDPIK